MNARSKYVLYLILIFSISLPALLNAQSYTDYKPQYQQFQSFYIIDKIEYNSNRTIVFFRFVAHQKPVWGTQYTITYFGVKGESPWFLYKKGGKPIKLIEIRNIAENGKILVPVLNQPSVSIPQKYKGVYTCEIHFPKLPQDLDQLDLIEGFGNERSTNHFNAFKVKFKKENDELGSQNDETERLNQFNKTNGLKSNTPEPKPEIKKPEQKPEPEPAANVTIIFEEDKVKPISTMLSEQYFNWVAQYLKENPNDNLKLIGHADLGLSTDKAERLANERVNHVVHVLTKFYKINPQRIKKVEAKSNSAPKLNNYNGRNRRVEIFFIK
jgi:outer membrane protein OmpA-like peptidoglycan-associated protein